MSAASNRGPARHLSQREIETRGPGLHHDGNGLYLAVSDTRRRWVFRYTHPTLTNPKRPSERKRVEMGLGAPWIEKTNPRGVRADAVRKLVREAHELLSKGIDPLAERERKKAEERAEAAKAPPKTFGEFADEWITDTLARRKNAKHKDQWRNTLRDHAARLLDMAPNAITEADIAAVLKPIWHKIPETAERLQGRLERLLDAARAAGFRDRTLENPARWQGQLEHLFTRRTTDERRHHPALPYDGAPAFMVELRGREGIAARALEFAILTAARSGEVRGMTWAELDAERKVWTIPASRMKAGQPHQVPLTGRAREILADMDMLRAQDRPDTGLVFPGQKTKRSKLETPPLSDMTLSAVLKRMREGEGNDADARRKLLKDAEGRDVVVHGFRSTFRTWAEDKARVPARLVEHALAHRLKDKVEEAYARGASALEWRGELMAAWEAYLGSAEQAGSGADIITLHPKRA